MKGSKLTTEEFIKKAKEIYGDKYDYSLVDYKNNKTKVKIICPEHGEFLKTPYHFITRKQECPNCLVDNAKKQKKSRKKVNRKRKKTIDTNYVINKIKEVHGDKYDCSLVNYIDVKTKIKLICPEHGEFKATYGNIVFRSSGCPKCCKTNKLTTEEFIKKAKEIYGDKYDYSLVDYKNSYTKVKIICPEHGEFLKTPEAFLNGSNCKACGLTFKTTDDFVKEASKKNKYYDYSLVDYKNSLTKIKCLCKECNEINYILPNVVLKNIKPKCCRLKENKNNFIKKAKETHGNKYDYSLVNYINNSTKVKIKCPKHGVFEMTPANHCIGSGCPVCKESKGERKIRKWLEEKNINFEAQKTFNDCISVKKLRFDFFIEEKNLVIEYNGLQHYEPVNYFGGNNNFEKTKKRDEIKKDYCKKNNINMLIIKYNDFNNIETILKKQFIDFSKSIN